MVKFRYIVIMVQNDYSFSFLKYRPDRVSGEFVNIGVLVWSPNQRFLGFRGAISETRCMAMLGMPVSPLAKKELEAITIKLEQLSGEVAKWSAVRLMSTGIKCFEERSLPATNGLLVWSSQRHAICHLPKVDLDTLFDYYIAARE